MARIPYALIDQAPEKIKDFFAKLATNSRVLNVQKMVANSPGTVREFTRFGNALLMKSKLSAYFRELAIIRISFLTGSRYEWAQHVPIALSAGLSKEQLEEINQWPDSSLFSPEDKGILQFTDEVFQGHEPSEETFTQAAKFLDPSSLVELTLAIGYWSMVGKFLRTFQVEIEESLLKDIGHLLPSSQPA